MNKRDHESDSPNSGPNRFGETRIFHDQVKSSEYVNETPWSQDPRSEASSEKNFQGKGPKNYDRPDRRIYDELEDMLAHYPDIDTSEIEFAVRDRHMYVSGFVRSKMEKWMVEDVVEALTGIDAITNTLQVRKEEFPPHGLIKGLV